MNMRPKHISGTSCTLYHTGARLDILCNSVQGIELTEQAERNAGAAVVNSCHVLRHLSCSPSTSTIFSLCGKEKCFKHRKRFKWSLNLSGLLTTINVTDHKVQTHNRSDLIYSSAPKHDMLKWLLLVKTKRFRFLLVREFVSANESSRLGKT